MDEAVTKRFPADTELKTELTFLTDKRVDAELYAYLLSISYPKEGETVVYFKDMPAQAVICGIVGIKSRGTLATHLGYLEKQGYIQQFDEGYVIPRKEHIYTQLPLETVKFLLDTCKDVVVKAYIYLGQRWKFKGPDYQFTQEEIGEHIGMPITNQRSRERIRNILSNLENNGLIRFVRYYEGRVPRYRLLEWNICAKITTQ